MAKGGVTGLGRTSSGALNPLICHLQLSCNPLQKWFKLHFNAVEICFSLYLIQRLCETFSVLKSGKLHIYDPVYTHLFSGQHCPPVSLQPIFPLPCSDVSITGNHLPPFSPLSFCIAGGGKLF